MAAQIEKNPFYLSIPLYVLLIFLFPAPSPAPAQRGIIGKARSPVKYRVPCRIRFEEDGLLLKTRDGYTRVRMPEGTFLGEPGKPMLPKRMVRVALPRGMKATGIRILRLERTEFALKYPVHPAQPPGPITGLPQEEPHASPDPLVYESPEAYPAQPVTFIHQCDLAGQGMALLRVCPVQYRPVEKKLVLLREIEFQVLGEGGYRCGDYLSEKISEKNRAALEKQVRGMVMNPEEVLLESPAKVPAPILGVAPGEYGYVIITESSWVNQFKPLADWRTKRGLPSKIVTLDWILSSGGYSGSDLEKIRAFIQDAHQNWGTVSVLLGGDTQYIPYHVRSVTVPTFWTDDLPNDTYYGDYDGDWVLEVNVGRAPVRGPGMTQVFVNKMLNYEKNPPLTQYATKAVFLGFDINTEGDGEGEICKELLRNLYLPGTITLNTEYDSEPGTHKADAIAYLNEGHHLVNHFDHCNETVMGMGSTNHGDLLNIIEVLGLVNGARMSILFTVGCFPAKFDEYACIGEIWIQHTTGGAVAFMGNTGYGWAGPEDDPILFTARQDHYFFRSLFHKGIESLGGCFTDAKNDEYDDTDPWNLHEYAFTQLTLIGDPELPVWTEDPKPLTVTHGATLFMGTSNPFTVEVQGSGAPLADVLVCLMKENDVYATASTDLEGRASFNVTPAGTGPLHVTVTRHNYLPHEGGAEVVQLWHVDDDNTTGPFEGSEAHPFARIQDGIDAASSGDHVLTAPGVYGENLDFTGKNITVRSSHGAGLTIIDGLQAGSTVTFCSGEGPEALLEGFFVTNGSGTADPGGDRYGGGIYCSASFPTLVNNVIAGNSADCGGGVFCVSASPILTNNTITENTAGSGGGIYSALSAVVIYNTILWSNQAPAGPEILVASGSLVASCCNVQGGWPGSGNMEGEPRFRDPSALDFHLMSGSPCIDRGDNAAPFMAAMDMDGGRRIAPRVLRFIFGAPLPVGVVDIGADECCVEVAW